MKEIAVKFRESIEDINREIVKHLEVIMNSIKEVNDVAKSYMDSISTIKTVLQQTVSDAYELENDVKL